MVIWIMGMSASGKTTIGEKLTEEMRALTGRPMIFMDGDRFRAMLGNDCGYTLSERKKNADRICNFCKELDDQGIDVIFSVLSLFHESQDWNRANIQNYFEVYLRTSIETSVRRDPKGFFAKAKRGEMRDVVGVDIKYNPPKQPDLIIDNNSDVDECGDIVERIIEEVVSRGYLKKHAKYVA